MAEWVTRTLILEEVIEGSPNLSTREGNGKVQLTQQGFLPASYIMKYDT